MKYNTKVAVLSLLFIIFNGMPRGYVFSYDPDHPPDGGK